MRQNLAGVVEAIVDRTVLGAEGMAEPEGNHILEKRIAVEFGAIVKKGAVILDVWFLDFTSECDPAYFYHENRTLSIIRMNCEKMAKRKGERRVMAESFPKRAK